PDYALAYTGIADYYNWLGVFGIRPFAETSAAAKQNAAKAVELDSTSAEAYRAIEINPNYATAHHWYAFHLLMEGRFDEAIERILRTRELDPISPSVLQAV